MIDEREFFLQVCGEEVYLHIYSLVVVVVYMEKWKNARLKDL
jgi:hypothetical protein